VSDASVVLVHGGAAGAWTWHLVVDGLTANGIDARAVDLPSCSAEGPTDDVHDDARHVRALLDEIAEPVVVVANSYGGAVITEAAAGHPRIKRLVYIAAMMPRAGEPLFEILSGLHSAITDAVELLPDGRIVFDPETDLRGSFQNAPEEEIAFIRPNLGRPMSMGTDPTVSLTAAAWEITPSTYVVCTDDLALPPDAQREWAKERATDVIEWPVDHSPQHSAPELVVDLIERLARE
jgi:pimeloyl-ACP methyl ester carboxylesterase